MSAPASSPSTQVGLAPASSQSGGAAGGTLMLPLIGNGYRDSSPTGLFSCHPPMLTHHKTREAGSWQPVPGSLGRSAASGRRPSDGQGGSTSAPPGSMVITMAPWLERPLPVERHCLGPCGGFMLSESGDPWGFIGSGFLASPVPTDSHSSESRPQPLPSFHRTTSTPTTLMPTIWRGSAGSHSGGDALVGPPIPSWRATSRWETTSMLWPWPLACQGCRGSPGPSSMRRCAVAW